MADAKVNEGLAQLKGPIIVFWISLVLAALGVISAIISFFTETFSFAAAWVGTGTVWGIIGTIFSLICAIIWLALYWIEIAAIKNGKSYAVPLGRFLIIWMMVFTFPVGTIIGAVIWKRFSNADAQKYLNYSK